MTATANSSTALDAASRTLFRLGRAFGRLPMRDLLATSTHPGPQLSAILVVQAVEMAARGGGDVTVGRVAEELGLDPSTASRLVAQSVQSGYLRSGASPVDRRARVLELSDAGRNLADYAARYQRMVFAAATNEWSAEERETFARLFVRFGDAIMAAMENERPGQAS